MPGRILKSTLQLNASERCLIEEGSGRRIALTPTQAALASLLNVQRTADELRIEFGRRGVPLRNEDIEAQLVVMQSMAIFSEDGTLDDLGLDRPVVHPPLSPMQPLTLEPGDRAPMLRQDLKTRKLQSKQGLIEVEDPTNGKRFTLYDFEVSIARMLNGTRTVAEVIDSGSRLGIPVTLASLRKFVRQLQIYGFVAAPGPLANRQDAGTQTFNPRQEWDPHVRELFVSGVRMLRLNRLDEARNYFGALLEVQPGHVETLEMLALVETRLTAGSAMVPTAPVGGEDLVPAEVVEGQASEALVPEPAVQPEEPPRPSRAWPVVRRWLPRLLVLGIIGGVLAIEVPLNVAAECQLVPLERDVVRASLGGNVREVFVTQGQWIEKGAIVAKMASADVEKQLERREAEVAQAQSQVELVSLGARPEEIGRTRAMMAGRYEAWSRAKKDFDRVQELYDRKHASLDEMNRAEERVASAHSAVVEASAQLRLVQAGARPEEVNKAKAELRARIADRDLIKAELQSAVLVAPISGVVTTGNVKEKTGTHLEAGAVFCEIEDVRTMRVVAKVAENDLDLVEKGQATSIKVANLPTRVFTGEVTFISPIVEEDTASGAHFFRIETVIKNDDGLLKPNLSGFAKLHAGSRPLWAVITRGLVRWLRLRFLF